MTTSSATVAVVAARPATQRDGVGRSAARLSLGKICAAAILEMMMIIVLMTMLLIAFETEWQRIATKPALYLKAGVVPFIVLQHLLNNFFFSCWAHKALFP